MESLRPKCSICGRQLSSSKNLKRHQATHSNERPFKCTRCDWAFKRRDTLQSHIQSLHGASVVSQSSRVVKKYRQKGSPPSTHGKSHSKGGTSSRSASIHQCTISGRILSSHKCLKSRIPLHSEAVMETEPQPCSSNSVSRNVRASKTRARMIIKAYQEEFHPFKRRSEKLSTDPPAAKRSRKEQHPSEERSTTSDITPRYVDKGVGRSNAAFEQQFWKDYFRNIMGFAPDSMNPDYKF